MYRDARLDNLIAGIEVARRTKEWRIVVWWAVKACAVALLRLHPRWKRAAEALILAVLGPEIRNRIKSKYLRKK